MIEKIFAGVVLALCAWLLLRLIVGERRRMRLDLATRRLWHTTRQAAHRIVHWRSRRREAARAAEEVIRRAARVESERDGNVYRPKSFRKPPGNKLH